MENKITAKKKKKITKQDNQYIVEHLYLIVKIVNCCLRRLGLEEKFEKSKKLSPENN